MSHFLELILILHSDLVVQTIEKGISLFQDSLSLLWIFGFRHYFGDLDRFIKKGQQQAPYFVYDLFSFYQIIIQTLDSRMIDFWFKEFYNFTKISFSIVKLLEGLFFQYQNKKTYEVVPTYWFALTLDPYSCERNQNFLFSSSSILYSFLYSKRCRTLVK